MKNWKTTILTAALAAITVSGLAAAEPHASLYQRLGGMPAIRAVVDDLVSRILADERVNKWFAQPLPIPQTQRRTNGVSPISCARAPADHASTPAPIS